MTTLELVDSYKQLPVQQQQEILDKAVNTLAELFPVQTVKPVYSIGFQRWQKLSSKKQFELYKKLGRKVNGKVDVGGESYKQIIDALQTKTVKEFLNA